MKIRIIAIAVVSALSVAVSNPTFAATHAGQPLTVNIKRLSLDTAMRIGKAAIEKCRKEGVGITETILDRDGNVQVVLRDTLAMEFNSPTPAMEDRFKGAYNVPKIDELVISAGGIPITLPATSWAVSESAAHLPG